MKDDLTVSSPSAWRTFLQQLFTQDPKLAGKLAHELGMTPITLQRWARHEASPQHPQRIFRHLCTLEAFAPYREEFLRLVALEYPEVAQVPASALVQELPLKEIPSSFYEDILAAYTDVAEGLRFWTIAHLVAQQLRMHLDPDASLSLQVLLLACTPPASPEGRITSLYAPLDQDRNPLYPLLQYFPLIFGAEATLTQALLRHQPIIYPDDGRWVAAASVRRRANIGGMLVVSARTQEAFSPARLRCLASYARALALAFNEAEFYAPDRFSLAVFPSLAEQQEHERRYPFAARLRDARQRSPQWSQPELERAALQAVAADLLAAMETASRKEAYESH